MTCLEISNQTHNIEVTSSTMTVTDTTDASIGFY